MWHAHEEPYLHDPMGNLLYCVVINSVPYLYEGVYRKDGSLKKGPPGAPCDHPKSTGKRTKENGERKTKQQNSESEQTHARGSKKARDVLIMGEPVSPLQEMSDGAAENRN